MNRLQPLIDVCRSASLTHIAVSRVIPAPHKIGAPPEQMANAKQCRKTCGEICLSSPLRQPGRHASIPGTTIEWFFPGKEKAIERCLSEFKPAFAEIILIASHAAPPTGTIRSFGFAQHAHAADAGFKLYRRIKSRNPTPAPQA
jgi:hypothetical protein